MFIYVSIGLKPPTSLGLPDKMGSLPSLKLTQHLNVKRGGETTLLPKCR